MFNVSIDVANGKSYCDLIEVNKGSGCRIKFNFNCSMYKRRAKVTVQTPNRQFFVYDVNDSVLNIPESILDKSGEYVCTLDIYHQSGKKEIKPFSFWVKSESNDSYFNEIDSLVSRVEQLKTDTVKEARATMSIGTGVGTNCWYDGSGVPENSFGNDGDYYLKLPEGDILNKILGAWERIGNIAGTQGPRGAIGPQGPEGPVGPVGIQGPQGIKGDGSVWYDGIGVPPSELGVENDHYLEISSGDVYRKMSDFWLMQGNIKGETPSIKHLEEGMFNKIREIETRFNELTSSQQQDSEVIDARKGEVSLKAKIDTIDNKLIAANKIVVSYNDMLELTELKDGVLCYVFEEDKYYKYLNDEWVEFKIGNSSYLIVNTPEDRDELQDLRNGVLCYVESEDQYYKYINGIWEIFSTGGGGGGGGETTVQRNIRILNNLESKNLAANRGEPCLLDFTFISQERYGSDEPYVDTGERGFCQMFIKNAANAQFVQIKEMWVPSNSSIKVDISEFLLSGANQIMIKIKGETTEVTTPSFVYGVQLTSLSISADNFKWWLINTKDLMAPINIGGNISKVLYVKVTGENYSKEYNFELGTAVYTETAYIAEIKKPELDGVYNLSMYVRNSDNSIKTKTLSYNVICVNEGSEKKFVAVNNIIIKASNWISNNLLDYCVYDGGNPTTSLEFNLKKDDLIVFKSIDSSVVTSSKYSFNIPLEIDTLDNTDFDVEINIKSDGKDVVTPIVVPVDNSLGFSAASGAALFINPKTRSNTQNNFDKAVNEMNMEEIDVQWESFNWGNDGWQMDEATNTKSLKVFAGSKATINYKPFERECARTGKTIELDFKIDNATNYTQPVISLSGPQGDSFVGLNVYADKVVMYSQSLKNYNAQSFYIFDGKRTRLTLVVMPDAYGNAGFNLCILYVNGVKNREFVYENNDYFSHKGDIVIGSEDADIDIYGIRIYNSALTSSSVLRNYVNLLPSIAEKRMEEIENDILDIGGSEIDYENSKDQYNVMVFDNTIPYWGDQSSRVGTLEVYFAEHPEWNSVVTNVTAKGQGTSSMKYWIWNTRYQLNKTSSVVTYADGSTSVGKWSMTPSDIAGTKFTAKKNFASSMQSHKIGAVNSYNDLYRAMGLSNEAMETEQYANARVSVGQHPFICFEKSLNEEGEVVHVFKGLFTFGADKGDSNTFGFDTKMFPNLISVEGSDNSPLLTLFRVPWDDKYVIYNEDEEAWQYNGANSWDFGGGKESNIGLFKSAYNLVYSCSPRLKPFLGTVEQLQAQKDTLRYEQNEFWLAGEGANKCGVYYYEPVEDRFLPSTIDGVAVNLLTQLVDKNYNLTTGDLQGKTVEELNDLFIRARIQKFRQEAGVLWDIDDALYFMNNVEFNAGTDERAKNTYPYCFGTTGSKFKWRADDMDTRFDITNRGLANKSYSVETHDFEESGAAIWNGETNNFFNLMELAFPEEKATSMRKMMLKMQELGGLKGGNDFDKLLAFYQKYFWDSAQDYFPTVAFNADAKFCYEEGKLAYNRGDYTNDTDPMEQSLGDHFMAEMRWVSRRIVYMMSKYSFGLFSANGSDTILVRAAGNNISYDITPAIDLYPAIANGTSIIRGDRTKAGEPCRINVDLSGSGDQQNIIQGASYLRDIGDWHDKNVTGSMIVQGRMLTDIRLGHKTEPITINISSLTLSNCISLQKLLLSRISTLRGTLDLTSCSHLQEVSIDGTGITQLRLPEGGGLRKVEFNDHNQYLTLKNYPLLRYEDLNISSCKTAISDIYIQNCPNLKPVKILNDIMDSQENQIEHTLKRVRITGIDETHETNEIVEKLITLTDGTYEGLDSDGVSNNGLPTLDGTIRINGYMFEDTKDSLYEMFPSLILEPIGFKIRFADPETLKVLLKHIDTNSDELISTDEAAACKSFGTMFANNEIVESFEEIKYFTGITSIANNSFQGCTNLNLSAIPEWITSIGNNSFYECANLSITKLPSNITRVGDGAFTGCPSLAITSLPETLTDIGSSAFSYCTNIRLTELPSKLTTINGFAFRCCESIALRQLPQGITSIGNEAFRQCYELALTELPESATNIGAAAFYDCINMKLAKLPKGLTNIKYATFKGCTNLALTEIPETITVLGDASFDGCEKIALTSLPESITAIGSSCFNACTNLALKQLPSQLTTIKYNSFSDCANLAITSLPEKVTEIEYNAFRGCVNLALTELADTITKIGFSAFEGCKKLNITKLPNTLRKVESYTFYGCSELALTSLPETVETIGDGAFDSCEKLALTALPANLKSIGFSSFSGCANLELQTLPEQITEIEGNTFKSCSKLNLDKLPDNLTTIGNGAFMDCVELALPSIPDKVTSIGAGSFLNCVKLNPTKLSDSLQIVGGNAFGYCSNLALTTLPNSITHIGYSAFYNCINLAIAKLPDELVEVGSTAFTYCGGITISEIPAKVESIGDNAFSDCQGISSITFRGTPKVISTNAFSWNPNLEVINVPWAEDAVKGAPWGATSATINYNYGG